MNLSIVTRRSSASREIIAGPRRKSLWLAFGTFVLAASLLTGEAFVRVADWRRGVGHEDYVVPANGFLRYEHHPFLSYVLRPNREVAKEGFSIRIDPNGFRSDAAVSRKKPDGVIRIATLGGSTTYDGNHAEALTYPGVLERMLSEAYPDREFEIINAGVPSWTTLENVLNLQLRLLDFDPDYIVYYGGVNNARANLTAGEKYRSDHTHFRRSFPEDRWFEQGRVWWRRWLEASRLFVFLRKSLTDYAERRFIHWYIFSVPRDALAASDAVSEDGLRSFENDLRSMIAIARAHAVTPVLATFVSRAAVDDPGSDDLLVACMRRQNEIMRRVAAETGIVLADVAQGFGAGAEGFVDAVHLSEIGNREIAKTVSDALRTILDRELRTSRRSQPSPSS